MERQVLYNQDAVLRRVPNMDAATLATDIDDVVDQMLIEHLCYSGHSNARAALYENAHDNEAALLEAPETPKIILP